MNVFNYLIHKADSYRLGMHKSNLLLVERNNEVEINLAYSSRTLGEKQYELTNHLGNVLAVISDKKLADNEPDVVSTSDYFPYGMTMPGRTAMSEEYRFGFNGKENINEVNGWQDYGERMYNVLTGRFFSPDPLIAYGQQYAELSSYQFASNIPILGIDLDGLEYLNANEARIEVIRGIVKIKVANLNFISYGYFQKANCNSLNWKGGMDGDIGINTTLANLHYTTSSQSAEPVNINANDENSNANDAQRKVENPTTKKSNYTQQDKRYKERLISGGSSMRAPAAKGILALNIITEGIEFGILGAAMYENYKIKVNLKILNKAIKDMETGIKAGLVPQKYLNIDDLSSILNVVLQGESNSKNKELYDIGMNIYNTISNPQKQQKQQKEEKEEKE